MPFKNARFKIHLSFKHMPCTIFRSCTILRSFTGTIRSTTCSMARLRICRDFASTSSRFPTVISKELSKLLGEAHEKKEKGLLAQASLSAIRNALSTLQVGDSVFVKEQDRIWSLKKVKSVHVTRSGIDKLTLDGLIQLSSSESSSREHQIKTVKSFDHCPDNDLDKVLIIPVMGSIGETTKLLKALYAPRPVLIVHE